MPELFEKVKKRLKKKSADGTRDAPERRCTHEKRQEAEAFCLSEFWRKGSPPNPKRQSFDTSETIPRQRRASSRFLM
jgi:hypothetical protein